MAPMQPHEDQEKLLDVIDDLRKHGIDHFVALPQIVVIGDQRSEKKCVLEAISKAYTLFKGTPFPIELILRTDAQTRVEVQIQSTKVPKECLFKTSSSDLNLLPSILNESTECWLNESHRLPEASIRIEIRGPDVTHLTLVDLPDLYYPEDEDPSSAELIDLILDDQIAPENSIILAIISAQDQQALQDVFFKIKKHDSNYERTLGIITQPDTLKFGQEFNCVQMARNLNNSYKLSLGWHVLLNQSETESSGSQDQMDQKEQTFFKSGLWSCIPENDRGIGSLRKKLSDILAKHLTTKLQDVIKDIEDGIDNCKAQLTCLGEPRSTLSELHSYLNNIAGQFHTLCSHAIKGNYEDKFFHGPFFGPEEYSVNDSRVRKVRALAHDLNRAFSYVLETKGSRHTILPRDLNAFQGNSQGLGLKLSVPTYLQALVNQYDFKDPQRVDFEYIAAKLESLPSANQGIEPLGASNDRLAIEIFQDKAEPWEAIARRYMGFMLSMTKAFVEKLVHHITGPDQHTYSGLISKLVEPFFEKKSVDLESKLQELLYHYKSGYPQPLDTEFRSYLDLRRQKNRDEDTIRDLISRQPELFTPEARLKFGKMGPSKHAREFGVDDLIDKSETYYEVRRPPQI